MPLPKGFQLENPNIVLPTQEVKKVNLPVGFQLEKPKGGPASFGREFAKGIPSFFMRMGEATLGVTQAYSPLFGERGVLKPLGLDVTPKLEEAIENIQVAREKAFPMPKEGWGWAGRVTGEAVPFLATSIASYGVTGSALGPFLTAFNVEGGLAYNEAKQRGVSETKAQTEGALVGTINGALEMWGVGRILKFSSVGKGSMRALTSNVRKKLWKQAGKELKNITGQMLKSAVVEGLEEMSQEGVSLAVPAVVSKDFPKNPDGTVNWGAILTRIGQAGLGGAIAGGLLTGGMTALEGGKQVAAPTQRELDNYKEVIRGSKLSVGKKKQILRDLDTLSQEAAPKTIKEVEVERTKPAEQVKYDSVIRELNTELDKVEQLRPEEEEAISKERGKRFQEYRDILSQIDSPIVASYIARSALAGELKMEISPLSAVFDTDKIETIFERVRSTTATEGETLAMFKGLQKLFYDGKIPARHEVSALELVFPKDTLDKLIAARKRLGKDKFNLYMEVLNIPRSLLASYDVSAPMRQGLLLFFRSPTKWAKAVYQGYRAFANEDYAKFVDLQIRTHPRFKQLKKSGLVITRVGSLTAGEEVFRSDLASKIPGIGKGIRASERAYVTTLNALRAYNFYAVAEQWEGKGHSADDYMQLAAYLNHATGRGDVKALRRIMPALGAAFFAPRLQIGRVQVFTDLYTKPAVRKLIAADLVKFAGLSIGLLTLLNLRRDVEVEHDPRSTDFGKVKIGNTRIDFLGGYQQLIRYTAQIAGGKAKSTVTGRLRPTERGQVLWRFIQSKLSPVAGLTVDAVRGETFLGKQLDMEPETVSREIYERLVPLFIQDVIDTSRDRGWDTTTGIASLMALHGINVMTYPPSAGADAAMLKNFYSQEMLNKQWDDLSPDVQSMLKEYRPQITLMERKARMERESTSFLAAMIKEQDAVSKRILKSLPRNIQNELGTLQVRISGLSRRIGGNWYLNEKRYKEYEQSTAKLLNKILPKIMSVSTWNGLPSEVRFQVVTKVIEDVKKSVREGIVRDATINDLEELQQ